jgi:hypothetical protein
MGCETAYQIDTLIQLNVVFFNVQLNQPADPVTVSLFVEDPSGTITEIASNLIVRTGVGSYYSNFLPTGPGVWTYKWQGTGNVIATSKDKSFLVQASDLVD